VTDSNDLPPTEDLPPLHRWISTATIAFDVDDLKRLAKDVGDGLVVEEDELGLAIFDAAREPVLWVDAITQASDTREDFDDEMAEFRGRIEGRAPAVITRVLDRARTIVALTPFRRAAPEAADALAALIGDQVKRQGDAVLHIVGKGFFSADGALLLAETD